MGDNLAQLLYTAFVNASSSVAGGDVPNWASLPAVDREQWEQVATRARIELGHRFACDMRDASAAFGAEQAVANLIESRLAK